MNNVRNEMKIEGIFSITEAKEWISDLEAEWKSLPWNKIKFSISSIQLKTVRHANQKKNKTFSTS